MKKYLSEILILCLVFTLSGCASIYDKEYSYIEDYVYPTVNPDYDREVSSVNNLSELKSAILDAVYAGSDECQIIFAEDYRENESEDLANACWQIRSQDALCAYCVEDISYDLTRIVTYNEANVNIKYADIGIPFSDIHLLTYATGLKDIISTSINNLDKKIVLCINRSSYSSNEIEDLVTETYRERPIISPVEPSVSVNMFSGNNSQRVYELVLDYGLSEDELITEKELLDNISLFSEEEINLSDREKAEIIYDRLNTDEPGSGRSVYDSLVLKNANSEGNALGFVALANEIGIDARIVYGKKLGMDFCWNIVKVDSNYYHVVVDPAQDTCVFSSDEEMWSNYRWDTSEYPQCISEFPENESA